MHLQPDELVDLAEGTRPEASAPHLASCGACRQQLADMRAMMAAASGVDVPEPSPLFWDHLSARVDDAVAAEGKPRPAWLDAATWRRALVPAWAIAVASLVIVVAVSARLLAPQPPAAALNGSPSAGSPQAVLKGSPDAAADANARRELLGDAASDDASLMLVANLTSAMDLDAVSDAGLAPSGSAEHAVTHMADGELRELQRLLRESMVSP